MTESAASQAYRVLARKYRPKNFSTLVGQDAMVRTLSNAIESNRLAHAFILTGVRGVGKTTTARIIACALNCVGADGRGGPTVQPCGQCHHCVSIANDSDVDVIEMDAASHTSVDNIRELIENIVYRPVNARYRIYIIDEVHMLSRSAFNALLKTLEEPPEYAKFIFATTEIRKVPVTVLSRCQRFDLRRIEPDVLVAHLAHIAEQEQVGVSREAIELITRAAGGSVRDGLSLLDQAIAHCGPGIEISEKTIREMLGVAERVQVFDLFEQLMKGDIAEALARFNGMYLAGADPLAILQDVAELTHFVTRIKAAPDASSGAMVSDFDLERSRDLADRLQIPVLTRTWQMLLKGISEVESSYSAVQAAEMVLVRIAFASDLPPPSQLVELLSGQNASQQTGSTSPGTRSSPSNGRGRPSSNGATTAPPSGSSSEAPQAPNADSSDGSHTDTAQADGPSSFEEVVSLFEKNRESLLHAHLMDSVHLISYEQGRIVIRTQANTQSDIAQQLGRKLSQWTGSTWLVEEGHEEGQPTLGERGKLAEEERKRVIMDDPTVRLVIDTFPGAEVTYVRQGSTDTDQGAQLRMKD